MRVIITYLLLYLILVPGYGQKHDNNWICGIYKGETGTGRAYNIKFIEDEEIEIDSVCIPITMRSGQITISDAEGNLLFYTNGNYIVNRFHEFMPNGKALNQGSHFYDNSAGGYVNYFPYGYMVIPDKEDSDIYYLIHPQTHYPPHRNYQYGSTSDYLKCTRINMRLDGGEGDIDERERIIYPVKSSDRYRIIQHGNGRDYWFLTKDNNGQNLHVLLFSRGEILQSNKISLYDIVDYLHTHTDSNLTNQGLLEVANSGNFFVDYKGGTTKVIYDFDRCTGEVSYRSEFYTPIDTYQLPPPNEHVIKSYSHVMLSFSPSDRYTYCSSFGGFYQYDLEADDISGSVVQLFGPPVVMDDNQDPIPNKDVSLLFSMLGPDGKIYILRRRNHYVIHEPDKKGVACRFDGPLGFGRNIYFDAPLYPNYRMGPLQGSACDTIDFGDTTSEERNILKIYPNPTPGPITVELELPGWDREGLEFIIYDALGKRIYAHNFGKWTYLHTVDPGMLTAGVYIVQLKLKGRVLATEKIVVQ
jgi:hypothetical protein